LNLVALTKRQERMRL